MWIDVSQPRVVRALCLLSVFFSVLFAKCGLAEFARIHFQMDIRTAQFIWLPSLLLGGVCLYLYASGPGSPFAHAARNQVSVVGWGGTWLVCVIATVQSLPSIWVPVLYMIAAGAIALGVYARSKSWWIGGSGLIWVLAGFSTFMLSPAAAFLLMAVLFVTLGALPSVVALMRQPRTL